MILEKIVSELHFTSETEQQVLHKIRGDEKQIDEMAKIAYHGNDFQFPLCKRRPLTRLSVVTYLLIQKYDEYKKKGTPDSVIFDTFKDVALRADIYCKKTGESGIAKNDVIWFRHIMNVSVFKIGSLQFQPFSMIYLDEETIGEPYMTFTKEQKDALPEGSPVLNCHIQQRADLNPESVAASFRDARIFFSKSNPEEEYKAFLCYSWLLYPPMQEFLSDSSNIKQFAARFAIIGSCSDSEQAMENLFGHKAKKEYAANMTHLQKMALERPEQFGFACGIINI